MNDGFCDRCIDRLFHYGPCLFLTLLCDSKRRWVRMTGLALYVVTVLPLAALAAAPMFALFFGWIIERTWNGKFSDIG